MAMKFVGDVKIDSTLQNRISNDMLDLLRKDSQVVANLEAPVTLAKYPAPKWASLKQSPEMLKELKMLNVKAVSLANNHMLDYGIEGLFDTIKNLKKEGLLFFGAGKDIREALKPVELKHNSEVFHIYSVSTSLPLEAGAAVGKPGIAPIKVRCVYYFDPVGLQEGPGRPPVTFCEYESSDMRKIAKLLKNDVKAGIKPIVAMHWGMAYQRNITDYQREIGHKLIDSGAELVIGHHPHVLQEIEAYKGKMIFYSLGNFLWEPSGVRKNRGKWNSWPPQYGGWKMSPNTLVVDVDFKNDEFLYRLFPIRLTGGIPDIPTAEDRNPILDEVSFRGQLKSEIEEKWISVAIR